MNLKFQWNWFCFAISLLIGIAVGYFISRTVSSSSVADKPITTRIDKAGLSPNASTEINKAIRDTGAQFPGINVSGMPNGVFVPFDQMRNVIRSPIPASLIPDTSMLVAIGVSGADVSSLKNSFASFKIELERVEAANTKLKTGPDGEYFEIAPFELPGAVNQLRSQLEGILGRDNWRVDFLTSALAASPSSAGFGKYRREVSIETERDVTGASFEMLNCKIFDKTGKQIDRFGFQVTAQAPPPRYSSLFNQAVGP